jgi:hypothetical protein
LVQGTLTIANGFYGDPMAEEEKPSLHIDLDWKKQAQEEKRRLEEEEKKRAAEREAARAAPAAPAAGLGAGLSGGIPGTEAMEEAMPARGGAARGRAAAGATRGPRGERVLPAASVPTLVQSLATQIAVYLGEMMQRDEVGAMDMAKHLIDTLGVVEEKTKGNLTAEEQKHLELALYETRMRFIGVAGQVIAGQ